MTTAERIKWTDLRRKLADETGLNERGAIQRVFARLRRDEKIAPVQDEKANRALFVTPTERDAIRSAVLAHKAAQATAPAHGAGTEPDKPNPGVSQSPGSGGTPTNPETGGGPGEDGTGEGDGRIDSVDALAGSEGPERVTPVTPATPKAPKTRAIVEADDIEIEEDPEDAPKRKRGKVPGWAWLAGAGALILGLGFLTRRRMQPRQQAQAQPQQPADPIAELNARYDAYYREQGLRP